ncbi:MAG: 5-oxoprolinase subunit PxpB [Balneola sp.]
MESGSLQLNGISWTVFRMGETTWLLRPNAERRLLDVIHQAAFLLEFSEIQGLTDVIPAYESLTVIFNSSDINVKEVLSDLETKNIESELNSKTYEIKVCYELGMDWKEMETKTGLTKEEIIFIHSSREYSIAMMGFLPGFIFLDGLDDRISVSRKENPRTKIPAGSVGIGGNQTGIYSIESPGGWQIIGRSPSSFFDITSEPPTKFRPGDKVKFVRITKAEFETQENRNG